MTVEIFAIAGDHTWIVPDAVTSVKVELVVGGGGGGRWWRTFERDECFWRVKRNSGQAFPQVLAVAAGPGGGRLRRRWW